MSNCNPALRCDSNEGHLSICVHFFLFFYDLYGLFNLYCLQFGFLLGQCTKASALPRYNLITIIEHRINIYVFIFGSCHSDIPGFQVHVKNNQLVHPNFRLKTSQRLPKFVVYSKITSLRCSCNWCLVIMIICP